MRNFQFLDSCSYQLFRFDVFTFHVTMNVRNGETYGQTHTERQTVSMHNHGISLFLRGCGITGSTVTLHGGAKAHRH